MEETMRNMIRLSAAAVTILMGTNSFSQPITTVLRLKEKVKIEDLASRVSSPVSIRYQNAFSPEEIKALSAPSEADYQALIENLKSEGFEVNYESNTHLWISVRADEKTYEKVFATKIQSFAGARHNLMNPQIPNHLALVESVTGLDNSRKAYPKVISRAAPTDVPQGIKPSAIKKAYNFEPNYKAGVSGRGQQFPIAT